MHCPTVPGTSKLGQRVVKTRCGTLWPATVKAQLAGLLWQALWSWASHLCWEAMAKYATGRDDDHAAQEYLDLPQSLVVIMSGVWCTAGYAKIWLAMHAHGCTCTTSSWQWPRPDWWTSCAQLYGVVQHVLICDNDDRQRLQDVAEGSFASPL